MHATSHETVEFALKDILRSKKYNIHKNILVREALRTKTGSRNFEYSVLRNQSYSRILYSL